MSLFLTITFIVHAVAFTLLGIKRRQKYYFYLTGTFTFLTTIYAMKALGRTPNLPGTTLALTTALRIGAGLCTLSYLAAIYRREGTWLYKIAHR